MGNVSGSVGNVLEDINKTGAGPFVPVISGDIMYAGPRITAECKQCMGSDINGKPCIKPEEKDSIGCQTCMGFENLKPCSFSDPTPTTRHAVTGLQSKFGWITIKNQNQNSGRGSGGPIYVPESSTQKLSG